MESVGTVTAEAIAAGVNVSFVFASDAVNSDAVSNLQEFERRCGGKFGSYRPKKIDVADPSFKGSDDLIPSVQRELLVPAYRFLYLSSSDTTGDRDETLFLLRAPFHDEPRRYPMAIEANRAESDAFREWENRVRLTSEANAVLGEAAQAVPQAPAAGETSVAAENTTPPTTT